MPYHSYFFLMYLGVDFRFTDVNEVSITKSITLVNLPLPIRFQVEDDSTHEEVEEFVLEVTKARLEQFLTGQTSEVFVGNSVAVSIHDNDSRLWNSLVFRLNIFSLF